MTDADADTGADAVAPGPVVGSIRPVPTVEEAVAIAAALEVGWPRLVVAGGDHAAGPSRWRFSGRWWSRPVPSRRARP
ncbi:MAG: hypothetical protein MUE36_02845 [Acidimicrobiales bacterium]|nr:hypothetical protein [Acidimicrobiales bacterium]